MLTLSTTGTVLTDDGRVPRVPVVYFIIGTPGTHQWDNRKRLRCVENLHHRYT